MGENGENPLAYVKVTLSPNEDWPIFKDHGGLAARGNGSADIENT
jgi:hypothetical protein